MHMGPNDISNINTKMNYEDNIKEWRVKVAQNSVKIHNLAKWCLNNYPSLRRVIIVKSLPRFDCPIKSHLSVYGNQLLDDIWMANGGDDRIAVAKQQLNCDSKSLVESYGHPDQRNWHGIHLRGRMAVQHMTRSFVNMLVDLYPHLKAENRKSPRAYNSEN